MFPHPIGSHALSIPSPLEVRQQPGFHVLSMEKEWHRPAPEFLADLTGEARPHRVLGNPSKLHGRFSNSYANQIVFGFHHLYALIGEDMEFNCHEVDRYRKRLEFHLTRRWADSFAVPTFSACDGRYEIDFKAVVSSGPVLLPGDVFLGSPLEPMNYGHWLLHVVPAALDFVAAGQPGRFLCYCDQPWQPRLLALLGIAQERIVPHKPRLTYHCERVSLQQVSLVDIAARAHDQARFRDLAERFSHGAGDAGPRRLFVSRRGFTQRTGSTRALTNEDEVAAAFKERGFVVVEPETLEFDDQVRLFGSAEVVAGPGGVGLYNVVFSAPGTKVITLQGTPSFANEHANLFASLGHRYGFIFGRDDKSAGRHPHNPWSLDVPAAMKIVDDFL